MHAPIKLNINLEVDYLKYLAILTQMRKTSSEKIN